MSVRRVVIDHVDLLVRDLAASRRFYEAVLAPLGFGLVTERADGAAFGVEGADDFAISTHYPAGAPVHVAFTAQDRAQVEGFHAAALAAGGRDNGAPGPRPEYSAGYYGAFVLDPDGNNIELVNHNR